MLQWQKASFKEKNMTGRIIIKSPDTDVLVLAVHYFPQFENIDELWLETGTVTATKDLRWYVPVREICSSQTPIFSAILPAVPAITGCDTTSSFFKISKNKAINAILDNDIAQFKDLATFDQKDLEDEKVIALKLTALLYDPTLSWSPECS